MKETNLQPHQQRVVEELETLSDKSKKLSAFILSDVFKDLPKEEKEDLVEQLETMEKYADILERRIDRF